jgi:3-methyladenine DNA glycosylase AlkD
VAGYPHHTLPIKMGRVSFGEGDELIAAIRDGLAAAADPKRAPGMQAYMKSVMPYRGVTSPINKPIFKKAIEDHPLPDATAWADAVRRLFHEASYREERYGAVALLGHRLYRAHRTLAALPLYEELIVGGAWWDVVDEVATGSLRQLLVDHPGEMGKQMRAWSVAPNLWKRRSSIICQVGRRRTIDLRLLYDCIEPNLGDRDFFIRKAIGWALRDYAWVDPAEIVRYVAQNEARLSGLSRREALKNVGNLLSKD